MVVAQLGAATVRGRRSISGSRRHVRTTLAQRGVELDDETLAGFGPQRPAFIEQVGQELVLSDHATKLGVAASDEEADEVVEDARAAHGAQFDEALAEIGVASDFASAVRRWCRRAAPSGGPGQAVRDCFDDFERLARTVAQRVDVDAP